MKHSPAARSNPKNVAQYRARMRKAGFRLIQLWVPDTRAEGFLSECRRQSRIAARHKKLEKDVLGWIEEVSETDGWR